MRGQVGAAPERRESYLSTGLLAAIVAVALSAAILAGATAGRIASALEPRLFGQITVIVWGHKLESVDAAAARASELLTAQQGVRSASVLEPEASDAIIGQLIAGPPSDSDLRLVTVIGASGGTPSVSALNRLLTANHFTFVIDNHRGAVGPLEGQALSAAGAAVGLSAAVCTGFFMFCLFRGASVAACPNHVFDLMIRLGATASYIGAAVGRRMAAAALVGTIAGIVCADLIAFTSTMGVWHLRSPLTEHLQPLDALWTVGLAPLLAGLAWLGGAIGAARSVRRRERHL